MKTSLEDQKRFLDAVRGAPGGPGFIMFLNERQKGCPPVQEAVQGNSDIVGSMMQKGAVGRYFTPANYRTLDGRAAKNVADLKSLFLDIDAGPDKPYATADEAREAAFDFATDIQMPISYVVSTGGGVHIYWLLQEPLEVERWKRLALGLKAETHRKNLKADDSVTGDAARYLRIPGSFNFKLEQKRPCEIIYSKEVDNTVIRHSYDALAERLISREPLAVALINPREPATDENIAKVKSALEHISADCDYRRWLSILMAIHSTQWATAEEMAQRWSMTAPTRFDVEVFDRKWKSLKPDKGITLRTLFRAAEENGWSPVKKVAQRVAELNEKHAIVMVNGKCLVLNEPTDRNRGVTFSTPTDLTNRYKNERISVDGKPKTIGPVWFEHRERRQYDDLVFEPGKEVAGAYNLFRGFAVEPKKGTCDKMLAHMYENLCRKNKEHFLYLVHWCADAIQNPASRPGTAVVLRGDEGTGKGQFASHLGSLWGFHYMAVSQPEHVTGKFNKHLMEKLLLHCDEAFFSNDRKHESVLKALITEPELAIEIKGVDVMVHPNYLRLIISTNRDHAIPAGPHSRRYFCLDVGEEHKQDSAYFSALAKEMDTGGREAFLHFLMNHPLKDVDLRKIPKTEMLDDQRIYSLDSIAAWWLLLLTEGDLPFGCEWGEAIPKISLYESYVISMQNTRERYPENSNTLGLKLKKLVPAMKKTRLQKNGIRSHCYVLPTLEECRAHFEEYSGVKYEWT